MSVAVVIPSFNSAAYLPAVVDSVLKQTRAVDEIVVVDDGSTDETSAVCAGLDARVKIVRQQNSGVSVARNRGVDETRAEWLLFLDSDDMLLPHAIETLLDAAGDAGVAYAPVLMRGRTRGEDREHGHPSAAGEPPQPALANYKRAVISTPGAAIVRRELHTRVGGFVRGFEPMEDRDFWVKCGLLAKFAFAGRVVLDKTFREGSAGTQIAKRIRSELRSRLALADWCRRNDVNLASLPAEPAPIVVMAIKDALHRRCWVVLAEVLAEAERLGVAGCWPLRARWQLRVMRSLGLVK